MRKVPEITPGEWAQEGDIIVAWRKGREGDGYIICQMAEPLPKSGLVEFQPLSLGSTERKQQDVNARLLTAAPEMYRALKTLLHGVDRDCNNDKPEFSFHKDSPLVETLRKAVIAAETVRK